MKGHHTTRNAAKGGYTLLFQWFCSGWKNTFTLVI